MKSRVIVACVVWISLLSLSHAEIFPTTFCSFCVNVFKNRGCLEKETFFCKFLVTKFLFKPLGADMCEAYPCEGYGQSGATCTGLLSCPVQRIRVQGICPINQLCCQNIL